MCKCIICNHLRTGGHLGSAWDRKIVQPCSSLFKNRRFSRENEDARREKVELLYKGGGWKAEGGMAEDQVSSGFDLAPFGLAHGRG
jgi:hypothetical protein